MGELDGKVAIVTGAGRMRGIGRAAANALAKAGANVVVTGTGRDPATFPADEKAAHWGDIDSVAKEVRAHGRKALPLVSNANDPVQVQAVIDRTARDFGRIDILINNAAAALGADRVPVVDLSDELFRKVVEVKLFGTFYYSRAVARYMIKQNQGGRIVNISSTAGKRGAANMAAYNAANFAVEGFTQALAKELAGYKITVNSVCPGLTDTSRMDSIKAAANWEKRVADIPMGRPGTDAEVADLIEFLCSPRAAFITGQGININGGALTER